MWFFLSQFSIPNSQFSISRNYLYTSGIVLDNTSKASVSLETGNHDRLRASFQLQLQNTLSILSISGSSHRISSHFIPHLLIFPSQSINQSINQSIYIHTYILFVCLFPHDRSRTFSLFYSTVSYTATIQISY